MNVPDQDDQRKKPPTKRLLHSLSKIIPKNYLKKKELALLI